MGQRMVVGVSDTLLRSAADGLDGVDLLVEARRRRPEIGRTILVPLPASSGAIEDAAAHASCWTPWEAGELASAVRRASMVARGAQLRMAPQLGLR